MKKLFFTMLVVISSIGVSAQNKCPNSGPIVTDVSCNATNDGQIEINYPNPCSSYTTSFLWSDGQTTNPAVNLTCGTYAVTITYTPIPSGPGNPGGSGLVPYTQVYSGIDVACSGTITTSNPSITHPLCSTNCNGAISFGVFTSNNGPVSYVWDNGLGSGTGSSISVSGLCAGPYSVTITDNGGCSIIEQFNLTYSSSITVSNISVIDNQCLGNCFGSIDFTAYSTNGINMNNSPFTWSGGISGSYLTPLVNLCDDNYTVTITDDSSCTHVENFVINNQQTSTWHKTTDNPTGQNDITKRVLIDQNGEVYVMGEFTETTTIDGQTIQASANSIPGQKGIFVAKYLKCGDLDWLVYSQNPNNFIIDLEGFDLDFNNAQQEVVLFSKQDVDLSIPIYFYDLGNSSVPVSDNITGLEINASNGSFVGANLVNLTPTGLQYPQLHPSSAKAEGNDFYIGGTFNSHASVKKYNLNLFLGNVLLDSEPDNIIADFEVDNANGFVYAGVNIDISTNFGLGLTTLPGGALAIKASTTPGITPVAQHVSGAKAIINDIELDVTHQLHVVGNYWSALPGWPATGTPQITTNFEAGYYIKFDTNFSSVHTAYQIEPDLPGALQQSSVDAIFIWSNIVHISGIVDGTGFKIVTPNMTSQSNATSGFGTKSLWVAKIINVTPPGAVVWTSGSFSNSNTKVTDIVYNYFFGEFYITGQYQNNITLPPTSSLTHPNLGTGQKLGFTIRGGEFQSPNSGYYYKKGNDEATIHNSIASSTSKGLVFPNPSNGQFKLQFSSNYTGNVLIELQDITGKIIVQRNYAKTNEEFEKSFNFSFLEKGMYFINIREGNQNKLIKLVIQ